MDLEYQHDIQEALEHRASNIVILSSIDSTHQLARRLIDQVDADDVPLRTAVIVAERQTSGRGRGARRWESPRGGLYLSWVCGDLEPSILSLLPLLAAAAAQRAFAHIGVAEARIKWPNDVLVGGRKIAGLLVHARHGDRIFATIGLGANITHVPEAVEDTIVEPTSVASEIGPGPMPERAAALAAAFLDELQRALTDPDSAVDHWRDHLVHTIGDPINVRLSGGEVVRGRFAGVNEHGHMRIAGPTGERTLNGGDVIEN